MASASERLTRRFGLNLTLELSARSLENFVVPALLITFPGVLGEYGIVLWFSLVFILSAIMEVPTGYIGDRFGWRRSISLGYWFRILAKILFIAALACAFLSFDGLAIVFFVLHCLCESSGTAMFSGSFQAGYASWYSQKLRDSGVESSGQPNIFLASARYGLWIRILSPVFGLAAASALGAGSSDLFRSGASAILGLSAVSLLPMIPLLLAMVRIDHDLSELVQIGTRATEGIGKTVAQIVGSLRENRGLLISYVYSDGAAQICLVYICSAVFDLLENGGFGVAYSWMGGGLFLVSVEVLSSVLRRFVLPRLSDVAIHSRLLLLAPFITLVCCGIYFLVRPTSSMGYELAALLFLVIVSSVVTQGLTSFVVHEATERIEESHRATWLSSASLSSLICVGVAVALVGGITQSEDQIFGVVTFLGLASVFFLPLGVRLHSIHQNCRP